MSHSAPLLCLFTLSFYFRPLSKYSNNSDFECRWIFLSANENNPNESNIFTLFTFIKIRQNSRVISILYGILCWLFNRVTCIFDFNLVTSITRCSCAGRGCLQRPAACSRCNTLTSLLHHVYYSSKFLTYSTRYG